MGSRVKNASRNIVFGIALKLYQIIVPFVMRTIMIYYLGVEYLGLNSLFTSILSVLSIAELGVGTAMVFHMYEPIAKNDDLKVCALLKLYKVYYRIIGTVILVVGMSLCPFLNYIIKSDVPNGINIYLLYILNLMATVLSYWLFAYRASVLDANQRTDLKSKVTLVVNTFQYLIQAFFLIKFKNYYAYVIVFLVFQVINNLLCAYLSKKNYPNYKPLGELNKEEKKAVNQKVKDLFSVKIGATILNSADTIVISTFMGLSSLAIYQNYFYVISSLNGIVVIILSSMTASVGNSIVLETPDKNYKDFKNISFLMNSIFAFIVCELMCLYQDFMEIWTGKELLLSKDFIILFCMYFYIYVQTLTLCLFKDAAGIWHSDRLRPLVTGVVNFIVNIVLVQFIGLYGILVSTIVSLTLIGYPWLLKSVFTEVFKNKGIKEYLTISFKYFVATVLIASICYCSCLKITSVSILNFIIKGFIVLFVFSVIWLLMFNKEKEFKNIIGYAKKIRFKHN